MTQRNRRPRLEPANGIIMDLGGYDVVAGYLNKSVHTIYGWAWPHDLGGCGGYIPRWHHDALMDLAKERKISRKLPRVRFSMPPSDYERLTKLKRVTAELQQAS